MTNFHQPFTPSRREFLARAGAGFGSVGLASLLQSQSWAEVLPQTPKIDPVNPLTPRPPHFAPTAKRVIFLFQAGAPGQMDTFDYKPLIAKYDGQPIPESVAKRSDNGERVFNPLSTTNKKLLSGPWKWKQHGQCGLWASELMSRTAEHADDLCLVRSMASESSNHAPAAYLMNTGVMLGGHPSLGSWLTYGLGSENQNLPGFVLLLKVAVAGGAANWSNGFLPAAFQGTRFRYDGPPVLDLSPPERFAGVQRSTIDLVQALNRQHLEARPGLLDLEGRIASYELAYRMQAEAMNVGDLSSEPRHILDLYGVDDPDAEAARYGRSCLLARRLVEKGVRVVQLYQSYDGPGWDAHTDLVENHRRNARIVDQATGALLRDLKQRGLLDETLVIWAGEFGRTPTAENGNGRGHNALAFTIWMAGGGVKGGRCVGETDEASLAAYDPFYVKDLHATILTAMGLNPDDLSFRHNGRPERLTGVAGGWRVIPGVLS